MSKEHAYSRLVEMGVKIEEIKPLNPTYKQLDALAKGLEGLLRKVPAN